MDRIKGLASKMFICQWLDDTCTQTYMNKKVSVIMRCPCNHAGILGDSYIEVCK